MFSHIDLLTLLFAPVIAYLVAAFVFAMFQSKFSRSIVTGSHASLQFTDGHSK